MMENKRDLSAVVWLRDKSLCSWYLFFAHIQAGDITPGFKPGHHVKAWGINITPFNYTLYLIFRELAIVGDIYRGLHELHTQPWISVTYTIHPT